jgi:C-terminal processing protease CtpA/Prc
MDNDVLPAEDSFDKQFDSQFDTEEQHYEVNAPAGKLGMVIDTPSGGAPVVHAIKSTSSMVDKGVQVGDRLVAIDGIDTTGLTAMQVSKLISQKAANPSRILEFVRTKTPGISQ